MMALHLTARLTTTHGAWLGGGVASFDALKQAPNHECVTGSHCSGPYTLLTISNTVSDQSPHLHDDCVWSCSWCSGSLTSCRSTGGRG